MIGIAGYLCLDLFPDLGKGEFSFLPGALHEVGRTRSAVGGAVGNTGGALCRLGEKVKMITCSGDDLWGDLLGRQMQEIADASGSLLINKVFPGVSSGYTIVLSPEKQDRMFLCCRGANDLFTADCITDDFLDNLKILHFGYPSLSRNMALNDGEETCKLFRRCQEKNIATSLDLACPAPGTMFYDLDWIKLLGKLLPLTDLFCPSIDELQFMFKMPDAKPEELADRALSMGCRTVFLKMGKEGILFKAADTAEVQQLFDRIGGGNWRGVRCLVEPEPVKVVGTTGAGDCSIAGFLCAIVHKYSAADAVKFASVVAGYSISTIDSISGIPHYNEIRF